MNTFSKLRKLYEYLDWKYFAWNDPDKEIDDEKQYFARNGYKHHFKRIHRSVRNDPSWNLIIWFAEKLQYKIEPTVTNNLISYSTVDVIDMMYQRFIDDYDPKVREYLLRLQEELTHKIEKRDKYE